MEKRDERKSQLQIGTPEGKRRIWASIPTPNLNKIHHENLSSYDLSHVY
jgi:hypothetical protein